MIQIRSLEKINPNELFESFKEAFKDYAIQLDKKEWEAMMIRRGFAAELSFGAFDGNKLVSFTLNGIGIYNGQKMAYDTGTGTIESHRGQGLATQIFNHSIPYLKEAGVESYILEVLQDNQKAFSVYKKLGFEISREFNFFVQDMQKLCIPIKREAFSYELRTIDLPEQEQLQAFFDFNPSWQNSYQALTRDVQRYHITGAYLKEELRGIIVFETETGDISLLAVDKLHRRKGIASRLISEILRQNKHKSIKLINSESTSTSISEFLRAMGVSLSGKQYEMIKKL